jgi:hypothetical protein
MFSIYNNPDKLFNYLSETNNKDLLYLNEYNIPISNKYFITLVNLQDEPFESFFSYIFDETREITCPFVLEENNKSITGLKWDSEQFYSIVLGEKSLTQLENDIEQVYSDVEESNANVYLLIDINYLINFLIIGEKAKVPVHIFDFLLLKLKKFNFDSIIIYDESNNYTESNLLYEQIKTNFRIINKYESEIFKKEIKVYKKIDSNDLDIYWNITNFNDIIDIKQQVKAPDCEESESGFSFGLVNGSESFISSVQILDIIGKNIFELENDPGIILDPLDKINLIK